MTTDLFDEFMIIVTGAAAIMDMEADDERPDPIGDAMDLLREADAIAERVKAQYQDLVNKAAESRAGEIREHWNVEREVIHTLTNTES